MPQTSVKTAPDARFEGQITKPMDPALTQGSIISEGVIAPGHLVLAGTAASQGVGLSDGATVSAETVKGICKLQVQRELDSDNPAAVAGGSVPAYPDKKQLTTVKRGHVALRVVATVTRGNPVFVGNATATLNQFRGSAATDFVQVPGASFTESGVANDLLEAKVDFL